MKIEVDLGQCQGYGVCAQIAPEAFDLDDDGFVVLTEKGEVPEASVGKVEEAVSACPAMAIVLSRA